MSRNQYWVDIPDYVEKAIERLPGHIRQRVKRLIADLANEPRPAYAEELQNDLTGMYKIKATVPVAAVALGACIIEKHFTVSRDIPSADRAFSLEPHEFRTMVDAVRMTEKALGVVHYGVEPAEEKSRVFRRSLFIMEDIKAGELFTLDNVRSIRPGHGLHTRYLDAVIGRRARQDVARGTPLDWKYLA